MNRKISIRKQILIVLEEFGGYQVPETSLLSQINFHISPSATNLEFKAELDFLHARKFIQGVPSQFGGDCVWQITKLGRGALADF